MIEEIIMDQASVVGTLTESADVLCKGAEMISGTGKATNAMETKRGHTNAYLAAIGIVSAYIPSPTGDEKKETVTLYHPTDAVEPEYTVSASGRIVCTFVNPDIEIGGKGRTVVPETAEFTRLQVFDAVKIAQVAGLPGNQGKAWLAHYRKEVIPAHLAHEVTPASRKLGVRMNTLKTTLLAREGETIMDGLQDAEDIRAELAGETAKDVRKQAKERAAQKKKDEEADKKPARDFAGEQATAAIRRLNNDESPDDYDHAGAIAAFRTALVCLNIDDPTLDAHDDDNK
jgi:hypothetical protein